MKNLEKNKKSSSERFYLWWVHEKTKRSYFAGVAFRDDDWGEYCLKIDCHPDRRFYLRDYKTQGDTILFRVEEHKKIREKHIRRCIGYAYSGQETNGDVEIMIAPHFEAKLILAFNKLPCKEGLQKAA